MAMNTSVQDKLALLMAQYGWMRTLAQYCTGNDILHLGLTSKQHWRALHASLTGMRQNWAYGLRCDGSGVVRWGGQNRRIWQGGPTFQCLDMLFHIPRARPCDGCGVAVCNICRFHLDRNNKFLWGWEQESPFDDESRHRPMRPPLEWRNARYRDYRSILLSTNRPLTAMQMAETIIAYQWRVYCKKHMEVEKTRLRKMLSPKHLPGPLCSCNPIERFVAKQWLCIECFEQEFANLPSWHRSRHYCAATGCWGTAVEGWKQCNWCKLLIEPCEVKGFNAVYRTE